MNSTLYEVPLAQHAAETFLNHQNRQEILLGVLLGVVSCIVSGILVLTNGNIFTAAALPIGATIVFLSLYRLDWGLNILIGAVLLFDQFALPGLSPPTFQVHYFYHIRDIPFLPRFDPGYLTPFEIHFLFVFFVWIIFMVIKKIKLVNRVLVWFAALVFFLWILGSLLHGLLSGGMLLAALWETRALMYLGIFYFFIPQVVHTKEQVQSLMWICIGVISFKAFEGIARFISFGFRFPWGLDLMTNSEDPVFMITILVLFIGLALFGGHANQRRTLLCLSLPLLLGIFVGNRRATYVSFVITIVALVVLLPRKQQRLLLTVLSAIIFFFGMYLGLFWNNLGRAGIVAQQVKSVIFEEPTMMSDRNYSSNVYREEEAYNLAYTIRESPVVGIGFGKVYEKPINLYLRFGLSDYVAHNSILWLFMRTGAIGFFLFFLFVDAFVFLGASIFSRLSDPYLKAVCAMCVLAIINQIVVNYVEMQFIYYRNMAYLGFLMGLLPALEAIDRKSAETAPGT
jgi:hypothetical protein